jgi:tRNA-dihydrouridine synthase B
MNKGFWQNLKKPIIGLAPMDGVTDAAFRHIAALHGKPSLVITEFTSVEGIRAGAERLLDDFKYSVVERPVVAQLFGADPAAFYLSAAVATALGFDGIDINMGCPAKNVTHHGAGAALILDPERAKEIVRQTRKGTQDFAAGKKLEEFLVPENIIAAIREIQFKMATDTWVELPVSVKTRLGYATSTIEEWVKHLLEVEPVNITVHGRTLKQLYAGQADWEAIARAADIIHTTNTSVLGNGDIQSMADAHEHIERYRTDGVLIGRAAFGNPWLFDDHEASFDERIRCALEHARYYHSLFGDRAFLRMRKHLLDYVKGSEGAKDIRVQLMKVVTLEDVEKILAPLMV